MAKKVVQIKCRGAGTISIDSLVPLQGDLKVLIDSNYEKLKAVIIKNGFKEPISIWEDPQSAKVYILNGHQRLEVLRRMKAEGWSIPQVPVSYVEADNLEGAKKDILSLASQYGTVSSTGLKTFLDEMSITPVEFTDLYSFPELDVSAILNDVPASNFLLLDGQQPESNPILSPPAKPPAERVVVDDAEAPLEEAEVVKFAIFEKSEIDADAFRYFRKNGFPYPRLELHEQKQELNKLAAMTGEQLLRSRVGYLVADSYHPHRFAAAAFKMKSPLDSFNTDSALKKAISWHTESSNIGTNLFGELTLVNGTQACSNFRPAFAKYIYDLYGKKNGAMFDSSTGYGGRLVGFLSSNLSRYIGTDPNVPTFEANQELVKQLGGHKKVTLYNKPIEDLDVSKIQKSCDLAFTSPPYFVKEIYSKDDTQSCQRYKKIDEWFNGFLTPMLKKQFIVLKKGAYNIVNIEDVTVDGVTHDLVKETISRAKDAGFKFIETKLFELSARTMLVNGEKVSEKAFESVLIFKKT